MNRFVLDASALIALFNLEAGAERVNELLPESVICAVNLSEVVAKAVEAGQDLADFSQSFASLNLRVVALDEELAFETGRLRSATRRYGLSLGDRACLATASALGLTAVTADRAWTSLQVGIKIEVIR